MAEPALKSRDGLTVPPLACILTDENTHSHGTSPLPHPPNPTLVQAFASASNVTLNGNASVQIVGGDNTAYTGPDIGMEMLRKEIVLSTFYDPGRVACYPGTRELVCEIINNWLNATGDACPILWLCGAAGSGKSAVMQTVMTSCDANGTLAATCFLSDGADAKSISPSIAYQLASNIVPLKSAISKAVQTKPNALMSSISGQFSHLISKPIIDTTLSSADSSQYDNVNIISIDGLDECRDVAEQEEFVVVLLDEAAKRRLPFRFIIASRAESHFETAFQIPIARGDVQCVRLDEHASFHPEDDIELYLREEFKRILERQPRAVKRELPPQWPSEDQIKSLVFNASGQFIYASTVIKLVGEPGFHPDSQLDLVFKHVDSKALSKLDQLYLKLCLAHKNHEKLLRILKVFIHLPGSPPISSTADRVTICCAISSTDLTTPLIDDILGLKCGETEAILLRIRSLFRVVNNIIYLRHASFRDFLESSQRSEMFFVGSDRSEVVEWWYLSIIRPRIEPDNSSRKEHIRFLTDAIFAPGHSNSNMFPSANMAAIQNTTFISVGKGDHHMFQLAQNVASRNSIYTWIGTRAGTFNDLTGDFRGSARAGAIFFSQSYNCAFRDDEFNFIDLTRPEETYLMTPPYFSVFEGCEPVSWSGCNFNEITQWTQHSTDEESALLQLERMFPIPTGHSGSSTSTCNKETDRRIFTMIMRWTKTFDPSSSVLFFYGPSGGGKTQIMRNIIEGSAGDSLAAFCFFSQNDTPRKSAHQLFPMLAYQIARNIPSLASGIARAFLSDPALLTQGSLEAAFEGLIMKPVRDAKVPHALRNRNICITGLDLLSELDACAILNIITRAIIYHRLPFRFLISYSLTKFNTSVEKLFSTFPDGANCVRRLFLKGSPSHPCNAKYFLWTGFDDIRRKRTDFFHSSLLWPPESVVDALVAWSSGSLFFATHVLRFVGATDQHPPDQLQKVVSVTMNSTPPPTHPTHILDGLFTHILTLHPRQHEILSVFKLLEFLPSHTFISRANVTLPIIEGILSMRKGEAATIMRSLSSIVYLHDDDSRVGLYDREFMQFLKDKTRSGRFFIDEYETVQEIRNWCSEAFLNWSPKRDHLQKAHLLHMRHQILEGYKEAFRHENEYLVLE